MSVSDCFSNVRVLAVLLLTFASFAVVNAKLPRGFSQKMYCSACETIVQELSDEINREVDTKQIETGSFRVGGDGKQRGKKKVPYKRSDLHIETVFDQVCIRMSKLYRKAKAGDFFIKPEPVEEGEENEADEDHASKYQLTSICQGFVDDKPDELLSVFKSPQQLSDYHEQVCRRTFGACVDDNISASQEL
mmetsp:Transcript_67/g.184  ORF Transcript_67/g.184 Transcript_67/m.184 type:complete len:191 (+) Transcript_67:231-803(+)